jgi:hypothetical protein
MAVELVVVRRFHGMGVVDSRSYALTIMSVCNIFFVELLMFLFGVFGGVCGDSPCTVFMLLFMVLWVPISATLCRREVREVLMLWHAFMFLGLSFFPLFLFLLGGLRFFFL